MEGEAEMNFIQEVSSAFSDKPQFTRSEFVDYIRTSNPSLKENSFGWLLYDLCKKQIIERVAHNTYRVYAEDRLLNNYEAILSEDASAILEFLQKLFPLVTFIVWETRAFNEFANHQLARNLIFVESEKLLCESLFNAVHEQSEHITLYKPVQKEIAMYSGYVTVSVLPLTSEAPINGYNARLEKLLVDLFANKVLDKIISRGDYPGIFEEAFSRYNINLNMMLRYAKRRNKADEVMSFMKHQTSITSLGTENFND